MDSWESIDMAIEWATEQEKDGLSNYDIFVLELNRIRQSLCAAMDSGMRFMGDTQGNMVDAAKGRLINTFGMPRSCYPVLLRLAIMDYPQLTQVDKPSGISPLDSQRANAHLRLAFRQITGRRPQVTNWRLALCDA